MFGLSKRDQLLAAKQKAAELLVSVTCAVLKAQAEIRVAEAQTDASELKRLRESYNELIFSVSRMHPGESRHETILRYIKRMENPATTASAKAPDNTGVEQ